MADIGELARQLESQLSDMTRPIQEPFGLLQDLTRIASIQLDTPDTQDLILRALERRSQFGQYAPILDSLVREVGLFPYLDPSNLPIADQIAYEFHRPWNMGDDLVFHRPQARIYQMLLEGQNIALSAPTSFGKSLIIDAVIASGKFKNIVIIVPTLALIDETRRRLAKRFKGQFKIITHSFQSRSDRNIFVLTQERALEFDDLGDIDFFVIDEFYKLSPTGEADERSYLLNQAFDRLLKKGRQFYMLGPGISGVSPDLGRQVKYTFISEPYHTVVSEVRRVPHAGDGLEDLVRLCAELPEATTIFCRSPKRAQEVSEMLTAARLGPVPAELKGASDWIAANYHPQWHFVKALRSGIGVHHGRIPRSLAQYVVRKFNTGALRFLVCTSTLIEGVNTSAKNIIIFDNKVNKKKIDRFTFNNISGRSGRMLKHYIGKVFIFHEPPDDELPVVDFPVYSQPEKTPESMLIQISEDELTHQSREKLQKYTNQEVVSYSTLKRNVGIDLEIQVQVARQITTNAWAYRELLDWVEIPSDAQLNFVCELIWNHWKGYQLGAQCVGSPKELSSSWKVFIPTVRE